MAVALADAPDDNLLFAPTFTALVKEYERDLREVVATAISHGLPVPALSAAVSYFDSMRTGRSTANMIQGSRASEPVTAAQPTSTGTAPAAPPMTMFHGVDRFSHIE